MTGIVNFDGRYFDIAVFIFTKKGQFNRDESLYLRFYLINYILSMIKGGDADG